jgi:beta-phosphoglucomutase-like phosphatase (HAD superfamily)
MDSFAFGRYVRVMTRSVLLDLDGTLIDSQPLDMNRMKRWTYDALSDHRSKT